MLSVVNRSEVPDYSRLQLEHLVEPSDSEYLEKVRMDMFKDKAAFASQFFLEIDQFAQDRSGKALNVAEVDCKSLVRPRVDRFNRNSPW